MLLCVRVVGKAKENGLKLTLAKVYQYANIRAILEHADADFTLDEVEVNAKPFDLISQEDRLKLPEDAEDAYPLTELQAGMIFHSDSGHGSYHIVDSLILKCPFDPEAARTALNDVVREHPALRTSFDFRSFSEPLQVIHREIEAPFNIAILEPSRTLDARRL